MSPTAEIGENPPRGLKDEGKGKKGRIPLEELTRYGVPFLLLAT